MPLVSFYTPWKHHKTRGDSSGFVKTLRIIVIFQSHISPPVICGSLQKIFRCPLPEISWSYLGLMRMYGNVVLVGQVISTGHYICPHIKSHNLMHQSRISPTMFTAKFIEIENNFYWIAFIFGHSNNALARKGERKSLKNESVKQ